METKQLISLLRYGAIGGNVLFILWVSYNAIDEGFRGTLPEKFSYVGLMGLLLTNCFLLITKFKQREPAKQPKSL